MAHRRVAGALLIVLIGLSASGCSGEPRPSCGEYTLDEGESIPQEAVDCMLESDEDGALRVIEPPNTDGYIIATTYTTRPAGGILVTTEWVKDNGASFMKMCPDAVSVVELGDCEELHEGH